MRGLMQQFPLTLPIVFARAERLFADKPLISFDQRGRHQTTYRAWTERTRRLASVLDALGIGPDGRVATFAWNSSRHLELYFAVPCTGRILHTANVRLAPEQVAYTLTHARDEVVFVDRSLFGTLEPALRDADSVKAVVVMDDLSNADLPPGALDYETILADAPPADHLIVDDEQQAAAICYTSGTTGNPKAVVYSHRALMLHTFGTMLADSFAISERDVILPIVPMFHANGWGIPHAAVAAGSTVVFPGADLSPATLARLIEDEGITFTAGVPTVWSTVLPHLAGRDTGSLRQIIGGGSAIAGALSEGYRTSIGLPITQAWGMTETSPLCTVCTPRAAFEELEAEAQAEARTSIGYPILGVEARIAEPETGVEIAWGTGEFGELQVRGPWVASEYLDGEVELTTPEGWLHTGDVARVGSDGYIWLVDRTKDLVKSGGEWISSIELENHITGHPAVAEVAVIAVSSEKWVERPLACVVLKDGASLTLEELRDYLQDRMPRWWLPDRLEILEALPKTAVGKLAKRVLRGQFEDLTVP